MSVDIKIFGHTFHIGKANKPDAGDVSKTGSAKSKDGRKVSVSPAAQPKIPKGKKKGYTPVALYERAKEAYANYKAANTVGVGHKYAAKELASATKKTDETKPDSLKQILGKHSTSVGNLNNLVATLPEESRNNPEVISAVRSHAVDLLIKENAGTGKLVDIDTVRADAKELTTNGSVELSVSIDQVLKDYPELDSFLRSPKNGNFNDIPLRAAQTRVLQGVLTFMQAQSLHESGKNSVELFDILHRVGLEIEDIETKEMLRLVGGQYLSSEILKTIREGTPATLSMPVQEQANPSHQRKAPSAPSYQNILGRLKTDDLRLASDIEAVENHFSGLQKQGVSVQNLGEMASRFSAYKGAGWTADQFNRLCSHVANELKTGTTDMNKAFEIGNDRMRKGE